MGRLHVNLAGCKKGWNPWMTFLELHTLKVWARDPFKGMHHLWSPRGPSLIFCGGTGIPKLKVSLRSVYWFALVQRKTIIIIIIIIIIVIVVWYGWRQKDIGQPIHHVPKMGKNKHANAEYVSFLRRPSRFVEHQPKPQGHPWLNK